jgi:hypothetical protein
MNHFCTYCDQGYAARLLCLHDSLRAQGEPFRLHVLCFDAATAAVVTAAAQPSLIAVALGDVLAADPDYAAVRGRRTAVEFFFTATPVFVRHCFGREPAAERMTYLDADLFFFGPPSAVFAEQGEASVGLVPHRFPARLAGRAIYGTYNVAWVSFRRDRDGLAALEWWRERCLEWCHDRLDQGRFADQGYLDEFPRRFGGVRGLDHPGINAAPWNMDGVRIAERDGRLSVNDRPLLFYHFQGIRELLPGWFDPGLRAYTATLTPELRDVVYRPYLKTLVATQRRLQREHGIAPRLGYDRLKPGASWRERWERAKARWLWPHYRRFRGELLRVAAPAETAPR